MTVVGFFNTVPVQGLALVSPGLCVFAGLIWMTWGTEVLDGFAFYPPVPTCSSPSLDLNLPSREQILFLLGFINLCLKD